MCTKLHGMCNLSFLLPAFVCIDGSTADDTRLVLIDLCCIPESKRSTAYFKFDQKNKEIEHKSGKVLDRSDSFVVLRTRGDSRGAKLFLADRSGAALDKAIR